MEIDLYTISDFNNTIDREIGDPVKISGTIKEESFSILQPVFLLKNPSEDRIFKYNYLYSPDFNRYYFITDYNIMNNGTIQVYCKVDVLKTYVDLIKNSSGLIERGVIQKKVGDGDFYFGGIENIDEGYTASVNKFWTMGRVFPSYDSETKINSDGTFILLTNRGD